MWRPAEFRVEVDGNTLLGLNKVQMGPYCSPASHQVEFAVAPLRWSRSPCWKQAWPTPLFPSLPPMQQNPWWPLASTDAGGRSGPPQKPNMWLLTVEEVLQITVVCLAVCFGCLLLWLVSVSPESKLRSRLCIRELDWLCGCV